MKVLFFGTPQFAADVLLYLIHHGVDVAAVVTRVDKPKGRSLEVLPSPVKQVALEHGLPLHQPPRCSTPEMVEILKAYAADFFVVVAYGEIVKESVLQIPPKGCINVHASLLPKYRGAAPIHRAIIEGETQTGVSIMYMVKAMDAGDVLATRTIPIPPDATYGQIELQLRQIGAEALLDTLQKLSLGPVSAVPQDPAHVTFAKKIELEECQINWSQPAQHIHNLVRGTNPTPGAWTFCSYQGVQKRLKVLKTEIEPTSQGAPGTILAHDRRGILVACGSQALWIVEVKPEGKRAMTADAMMRGLSASAFSLQ